MSNTTCKAHDLRTQLDTVPSSLLLHLRCDDIALQLVDQLERTSQLRTLCEKKTGRRLELTTSRIVCADFDRISSTELGEKNAVWHVKIIPVPSHQHKDPRDQSRNVETVILPVNHSSFRLNA